MLFGTASPCLLFLFRPGPRRFLCQNISKSRTNRRTVRTAGIAGSPAKQRWARSTSPATPQAATVPSQECASHVPIWRNRVHSNLKKHTAHDIPLALPAETSDSRHSFNAEKPGKLIRAGIRQRKNPFRLAAQVLHKQCWCHCEA